MMSRSSLAARLHGVRSLSLVSHAKRFYCRTMSLSTSKKPSLHEALNKVSWLLGKWVGEGCGVYPTISPFMYGEEVIFDHVGQPMLSYNLWMAQFVKDWITVWMEVSSSLAGPSRPCRVVFGHAGHTGLTEIEEGEVDGHKIRLVSHTVGRTSFNKDPKVVKIERLYTLKDPDTLEMECFMETNNTDHQKHLHITYKKVKE